MRALWNRVSEIAVTRILRFMLAAAIVVKSGTSAAVTFTPQPYAKYSKDTTAGATTAVQGSLTGAGYVSIEYSAIGTANVTTRTAAQMIADEGYSPGHSYVCEIVNTHATLTLTLVGGTGVTITGTATVAALATRRFNVTVNSPTTMVFQAVGVGTIS